MAGIRDFITKIGWKIDSVSQAGRVSIYNSAGVVQDNLSVNVSQNVTASIVNSSTANISAGASFVGVAEDTLGVNAIQITFKCDLNCAISIQQSPDGTNWDIQDDYNYNNLVNNFGITVQAVGAYFRVVVTNENSTTTTSYLRLSSILCPVVEALPRALDAGGNLKTGIYGIHDHHGHEADVDDAGGLVIAEKTRLIGNAFSSAIDTNFWTTSTSGAGSASGVALGIATITSGTANSGYGQLVSVRLARLIFGCINRFRSIIRIPDITIALNTRRWGAFSVSTTTPINGSYFELSSTGVLSVNTVSNSVVTSISSGSFNGTFSEYILDTNSHAYEIDYWTNSASFYIDGVLIHKVTPTDSVLYQTASVPIGITSVNTAAGVTAGIIECWNATIFRLGKEKSAPIWKYQAGANAGVLLKLGPGKLHLVSCNKLTGTTISLYDATSATNPICIIDPAAGSKEFNLDFYTGLWMVTVGAGIDVTIIYE